jgi:PAS domain S-box-containing protein
MRALLLIDDSVLWRQASAELGRLGLEVTTAARDQIVDCYAVGRHELILGCWWQKDGDLAWTRELRTQFPQRHTVIVLATDRKALSDLDRVLDSGVDDYFHWPVSDAELHLRLRVAADRARNRACHEQVERRLRDSNERFELAVQGTNDGLWDAVVEGQHWHSSDTKVWYSRHCKELLGFGDDEFPNVLSSWESLLHPDDRERVLKALVDHFATRVPYDVDYRLRTKSGEYRWFSARGQAIWNAAGEVMRMAGSLRDITQTKEYERRLEESEEKWRSLVHNAPEIVVLADPDGTIRFVNRITPQAEQAIGQSVYAYVDPEYQKVTRDAFERLVATGEPQSYEVQSQAVGGGYAWYATRLGPTWRDGKLASIVLIATNITQRKIAEEQLQRERNALRRMLEIQERERQLVSYEIHDGLVQYLTGGLMHLEASAAPESMSAGARTDFQRGVELLREALAEGRRLIGDLRPPILDERGVVESLKYLVSEFQQDLPDLEFIEHAHCGRLAPTLEAAIFRITQEALSNVLKHSESTRARVELLQHGEWLRLVVRDWGKGFDPTKVREDRYGLQGIRQRARLLGSRAVIESSPGQGTTIVVDFPIVPAPAEDDE